jgi:hypothetical protein
MSRREVSSQSKIPIDIILTTFSPPETQWWHSCLSRPSKAGISCVSQLYCSSGDFDERSGSLLCTRIISTRHWGCGTAQTRQLSSFLAWQCGPLALGLLRHPSDCEQKYTCSSWCRGSCSCLRLACQCRHTSICSPYTRGRSGQIILQAWNSGITLWEGVEASSGHLEGRWTNLHGTFYAGQCSWQTGNSQTRVGQDGELSGHDVTRIYS